MTADKHRDMADAISRLFWDNFIKSEPAMVMRDVIAIELDKARDAERERCVSAIHDWSGFSNDEKNIAETAIRIGLG
jgi:hypothetical protein